MSSRETRNVRGNGGKKCRRVVLVGEAPRKKGEKDLPGVEKSEEV